MSRRAWNARITAVLAITVAITAMGLPAGALASGGPPQHAKHCGHTAHGLGVLANKHTSCPFARVLGNKFLTRYTARSAWVSAYSRAADRTVTLRCREVRTWDSPYIVCSGGNRARLWVVS
jgi:hypothetical protein